MSARLVLLVFAGGVLGTAAREAIVLAVGVGSPWGVLIANLAGAFLIGLLVRGLRARDETPQRRDARLFAGTGALGGFTTYSALATGTVLLLETAPALGVAYALGSVIAGLACAVAGWALASRLWPRHPFTPEAPV